MKKRLLYFILLISICQIEAQIASSANYSYSSGTTASLVTDMNGNAIDLSTQPNLTSPALATSISTMDIGFDYFFMGNRYTQFTPVSRGGATLGWLLPVNSNTVPNLSAAYNAPVIAPFWVNGGFTLTQGRNLRMKVVGTAPNRCCVMEWRFYFLGGTGGATPDVIFQSRMYESTGVLEYVYDTMRLPSNFAGAAVQGTIGWTNTNTFINDNMMSNITSLSSHTATTALASVNNALINASTPGAIPGLVSGRYYRWAPNAPSAPSSLSFSGVSSTNMTLSWTDNSSNEFGFAIYRSDDGGTTYNYITQTSQNVNTYTQTGLQPSTSYLYRVYAISEGGLSSVLSGSQSSSSGGSIISISNGNWNSPATWAGGIVPTSIDNVTIDNGHTVTINIPTAVCNNLTIGQGASGILRYSGSAQSGLFTYGNVTVTSGAIFDIAPSNIQTHLLTIGGNPTTGSAGSLTVDGAFDMNQVTAPNTGAGVLTTFGGLANGSISGSGTLDFYSITVNKGNFLVPAQNPILNVTSVFTINSPVVAATRLTITSGTFKISSATSITPYFGAQTICATGGRLWLNHSGASVSCVGTSTTTGAGNPSFFGELRMDNGLFAYGSGNNTVLFGPITINGVIYGGKLMMNGGVINIYGSLRMNSSNTISFTMSGGAINIDPQAANVLNPGSNAFTIGSSTNVDWSGGTVTIIDPHSVASAATATVSLSPGGTKNITGGTLKIGDGISGSHSGAFGNISGFALSLSMGVWNLVIDNRTDLSNTRLCRMVAAITYGAHYVLNDFTINNNGNFVSSSGGASATIGLFGNLINNGIYGGVEPGAAGTAGELFFYKTSGNQTVTGSGTFYNLATLGVSTFSTNTPSTVNVILNQTNPIVVNQAFMVVGTLTHNNKLTIGRTGQIPTIVLGGNGITTAPGSFATVPNFDNTSFSTFLVYNTCNKNYIMGKSNEIGSTTTTLNNLQINNPRGVSINRNLNIVSNLNLASGDLSIGNNNITIGTGASNIGTINHTSGTSGQIICGSTGTLTRWVNTTAAPSTAATTSLFPLGTPGSRRLAYVYYSAANALSSAGTVTVRHSNATGVSSMTPYTENAVNMDGRSNAGWIFSTGNGFALSGTLSMQLVGEGALVVTNPNTLNNITATDNSGAVLGGTFVAGSGTYTLPLITRTGMSALNLTNAPIYIGAPSANIGSVVTAINSGNWGDNATWNTGSVPTATDNVIIADTIVVTCNSGAGTYTCNNLLLPGNGSTLIMNNAANTLNVGGQLVMQGKNTTYAGQSFMRLSDGTINIAGWDPLTGATTGNGITITNGNITISGGTLNLSTAANCNRNLQYNSGYFNLTGGDLNIFGKAAFNSGGSPLNLFQSGGTMRIDPLGSSAATSCSGTTTTESSLSIVSTSAAASCIFSGGTIVMVDPPYSNNLAQSSANCNSIYINLAIQTAPANALNIFTGSHTVQLGDGISTSIGLSTTLGFPIETWGTTRIPLNNLIVNGGNTAGRQGSTSLVTSTLLGLQVKNLTINAGSEFIHSNTYSNVFEIGNSLVNNGTLTQSATTPLVLGFGTNFTTLSGNISLSGTGVFRNLSASPTASFTNLQVNMGNSAIKAIISPNNLSVSGTLTISRGNLDIGSNNFTLGVPATPAAGSLNSTGFILTSSGGTFTRVFSTSGLPTSISTGTGQFPLGRFNSLTNLTENRTAFVYFSTATALTTGGTVSIGHNHVIGNTSITPFLDGSINIDTRSNSNWTVTNSGLVASGTIGFGLNGATLNIVPFTTASTTICEVSSAAGGTYAAGASPFLNRNGMTVANITSKTFYGGIVGSVNLSGSFVAVANGNWDQGSTWNTGTVPTSADRVEIPLPYTVMLGTGASHTCKSINILSGGSLIANNNTLTVTERITNAGSIVFGGASVVINNANTTSNGLTNGLTNSGTVTMNGGTVRLGPVGGGLATLLNTGNLIINNGTIAINGNYSQTSGTLTMTPIGAAMMIVDGNDGATSIGSVSTSTDLFSISGGTQAITGGTITIVDPPFGGFNRAFNVSVGSTWTNNILNIGDGTSVTPGSSVIGGTARTGFRLSSGTINIGNVVVKGGNIAGRWASICNVETFTCTNLTINSSSELRTITNSGATLSVSGNVTNAGTLTISQLSGLNMNGANPQTFINTGTFRSDTLGANPSQFANLAIINMSGTGVDMSSLGNFSIGFGTVASGDLSLLAGPLNIGANTLTLGSSGTLVGSLGIGTGAIIHSSGGGFQRWISATVAPTALASASLFPLGVLINGTLLRRYIYVYHSNTMLTTAGTMRVSHTYTPGLSTVTSFTDGALAGVSTRGNGFWNVTTANSYNNGAATLSASAQGSGMVSPITVANITLMSSTGILGGTYSAGTNTAPDPQANRTGMNLATLTSSPGLYIGGPTANLFQTIQSANSGNWSNPATWTSNTVPTSTDNVLINSNHTIHLDANGSARDLTMNSNSVLNINANTLIVSSNYVNNTSGNLVVGGGTMTVLGSAGATGFDNSGSVFINSGTINLGQSPNFNRLFKSQIGQLVITGGNINVNGSMTIPSGTFTMSGGTMTIDGNDGSSAGGSVASGTHLFNIATTGQNVNGGTILIVDPPFTGTASAFIYPNTAAITWTGNTLQLGDGTSTHAGSTSTFAVGGVGNTLGFNISTSSLSTNGLRLYNLIVNGGAGTNRFVTAPFIASSLSIGNNLTINSGSELRTCYGTSAGGANINVGGNIVNDGILVTGSYTALCLRLDGSNAGNNPQSISGSGVFTNLIGGTGAPKFSNLLLNNTSTDGVSISGIGNITIDDVNGPSPTLTLTSGILKLGSNNMTIGSSAAKPGIVTAGIYAIATGTGIGGTVSTNGSMTRWFGTTTFTSPVINAEAISPGLFPLSVISSPTSFNRSLAMANTTTLTSGGTITVSHTDGNGINTGFTPFTDGGVNIDSRTNFYWTVSVGNGLTTSGTSLGYQVNGAGLQTGVFSNIANLRNMGATAASTGTSGTNLNTFTDPVVVRSGLDNTTIASTIHIGGPGVSVPIVNNNISAGQSIATGATPSPFTGTLPSGGNGAYAYQWESSMTNISSGFSSIGAATSQNYSVGIGLTASTWYRRIVTSGSYTDTSGAIQITLPAAPLIILSNSSLNSVKFTRRAISGSTIYYGDATNNFFAIDTSGITSGALTGDTVTIQVNTTIDSFKSNVTNYEHAMFLLPSYWDAKGNFTGTVKIRFPYNPADTVTIKNLRDNAWTLLTTTTNTNSLAQKTPKLEWFKTVGVPYNAAYIATIVGNKFPTTIVKPTVAYGITSGGVNYVELDGITSFSGGGAGYGYGPGVGVGLPVTWAGFEVKTAESGNELTWKTASEQNTDYFQVEYSYDGVKFESTNSKIQAAGNSASLKTYNFVHPDFASIVYYRIKQVDIDKRFEYSEIKLAKRKEGKAFQVAVYPTNIKENNELNIKLTSIDKSKISIKIFDMTGKTKLSKSLTPNSNAYFEKMDISNLSSGMYFVEISNGQGREVVKVVK